MTPKLSRLDTYLNCSRIIIQINSYLLLKYNHNDYLESLQFCTNFYSRSLLSNQSPMAVCSSKVSCVYVPTETCSFARLFSLFTVRVGVKFT